MPRIGAALVVLGVLVPSRPTFADDSYDPYDPAQCPEEGVVGRRRCPPYGEWGAALESPYVIVRFGVNMRRLPGATPPAASTAPAKTSPRSSTTTDPSTQFPEASATNYSVSEQIAVSMSRASYLAFEVEVSPTTTDEVPPGTRAFAAASHLVFGLHGGGKAINLGVELAGGVRLIDTVQADAGEEPVLEVRGRGDFWLSPWITIGAAAGTSLLERGDWFTGISLGIHSYAFGGG